MEPNYLDPNFYRSWGHLEALIEGIEQENNVPYTPNKGGQQAGIDRSWNHPMNMFSRVRELNRYCRDIKAVIKALKEDTVPNDPTNKNIVP